MALAEERFSRGGGVGVWAVSASWLGSDERDMAEARETGEPQCPSFGLQGY